MSGSWSPSDLVVENRRVVVAGILLVTVVLGLGVPSVGLETSFDEFTGGTASSSTNEYVEANFRAGPENATSALVIVKRQYHVVGPRDITEQLRFQRRLLNDSRVAPTLAETPPTGIANVVAFARIQQVEQGVAPEQVEPIPEPRPSIDRQLRPFEQAKWEDLETYERVAIAALNDDVSGPPGGVYAFAPRYYDHQFRQRAHATVIYVYQKEGLSDEQLLESQVAMREIADDTFREGTTAETGVQVYGQGIVNDELNRSTADSLLLVGPPAILFVLGVLLFAYRDPLDILLAVFGVLLVLVWTFGFMGWVGIEFNQLFVSIPVFLMGLSIDYAIHAFMRYREEREGLAELHPRVVFLGEDGDPGVRTGMRRAVGGVGAAFVLVTLTTATGFAASLTSPAQPIREFGLIAAAGIVAALVVFGALLPALKIELDRALEARGYDRQARAFATGGGRLNALLERPVGLAETAPWAVVGLALLATTAGLAGATTIDTTFDQKELHVESTDDWLQNLPEPILPGQYNTHESLEFFRTNGFVNERNIVHLLVRGDVTRPGVLQRVHEAWATGGASNATLTFGRDQVRRVDASTDPIPNGQSPVTVMRNVAVENETFNRTLSAADTDGDRIPDRNLTGVYDTLYAVDQEAARTVVHREDGEYRALRAGLYVNGSKPNQWVASEMQDSAAMVGGMDGVTATATGRPMIRAAVQQQLFTTILRSFALTLGIVLLVLMVVYRLRRGSATLGVVTVLPVLFALAWILGTMALLGLRFNVLTALITSFTIGLGVDYAIHVSERYAQELERQPTVHQALAVSVTGTGGALLGSALTTAGGFGVLAFAILNPLQQFGLITAMTIGYAFLASVVVLPSLLVLWTRYGTDVAVDLPRPGGALASLIRLR